MKKKKKRREKKKKKKKNKKLEPGSSNKQNTKQEKYPVQAVMFVPHTPWSELAKLLRANKERYIRLPRTRSK